MKNLSVEQLKEMYVGLEAVECTREVMSASISVLDELREKMPEAEYNEWARS